jgi:hypothetical protein
MGDRGNIVLKSKGQPNIFLYTHWSGSELPTVVQNALKRGKGRIGDDPYLNRIIFIELVKDDILSETGFGLSTEVCDNEHYLVVVDHAAKRVYFANEKTPGEPLAGTKGWTFEAYINAKPEELEEAFQ